MSARQSFEWFTIERDGMLGTYEVLSRAALDGLKEARRGSTKMTVDRKKGTWRAATRIFATSGAGVYFLFFIFYPFFYA